MNITTKMIITDTNIITDLNNGEVLEEFVKLDSVYISDLIKYDEINSNTGNIKIINKIKVINATAEELNEISLIRQERPKLSTYDALNFIIARDNKCILATGDNELKKYALKHGVEVIRTLKIIELMVENKVITYKKGINACKLIKNCPTTRIPKDAIDELIMKLEKEDLLVKQ